VLEIPPSVIIIAAVIAADNLILHSAVLFSETRPVKIEAFSLNWLINFPCPNLPTCRSQKLISADQYIDANQFK